MSQAGDVGAGAPRPRGSPANNLSRMAIPDRQQPACAAWRTRGATLTLDTAYPYEPEARLRFTALARAGLFTVALRLPGWAAGDARVTVNGRPANVAHEAGYAVVEREWREGDTVAITLPLHLRLEAAPGGDAVAVLRGPLVLAADRGPAAVARAGMDPVLVGQDVLAGFKPVARRAATFTAAIKHPTAQSQRHLSG